MSFIKRKRREGRPPQTKGRKETKGWKRRNFPDRNVRPDSARCYASRDYAAKPRSECETQGPILMGSRSFEMGSSSKLNKAVGSLKWAVNDYYYIRLELTLGRINIQYATKPRLEE